MAVLPGTERSHLAGEFRDLLAEFCVVRSLRAAASKLVSFWPAKKLWTFCGNRLVQTLRRTFSDTSGARLLKYLRN
jgi:hypothetical protein